MKTLSSKYRGYWNYYGVIGNYDSLKTFYYQTRRILFKWLNPAKAGPKVELQLGWIQRFIEPVFDTRAEDH